MTERNQYSVDSLIKVLGALSIIIGGAVGLWKYSDSVENQFRKPLWEKQIALYFDATSAAATLASSSDPQTLQDAENRFWVLYYGPLALVEDKDVESAMVRFSECLSNNCEKRELKGLSLRLARACRESISESWSIELDDLADQ